MTPRTVLATLALVTTSLVAPLGAATPPGSAAEERPAFRLAASGPDDLLPRVASGREAVRLAGDDLDAAAAVNGMLPSRLRSLLVADPTVTLDREGRIFYRDDLSARSAPSAATATAPYPTSQTFTLHSKPGSQRTIYLDFNGATVSGTAWNGSSSDRIPNGTVPGFSLDGDYATFNAEEHARIQEVWQRVSEDYSPFDVDVTTQEPTAAQIDRSGSGDQVYGTTALVTASLSARDRLCGGPGCTGIAYIDVFNAPQDHAYYQPAWAFTTEYDDTQSIAETISHEVGHNLGLEHDGRTGDSEYYSGHANWTPIMGSGFGPVIQWSNGAYAGATNTQDDVAVIAQSGAPARPDEVGGTVASAGSALPTGVGIIGSRTDVDAYRIGLCTGSVTVTAGNAPSSPDLDIKLTLLDADGRTLASDDPRSGMGDGQSADGMGASITYAASAQVLYAAVDGVGTGSPTTAYDDYGSLGQYTLTASGCSGAAAVPGAAQSVAATATASSVTVTWAPPASDGGSPVTGYTVELTGQPAQTLGAGARSATFSGLAAATAYTATVRAVNAIGSGPAGTASVTTGGGGVATAPSAPRGLALTWNADAGGIDATWSAPSSDGGSPVTGYEVFVDGQSIDTTTSTSATILGGFVPGASYEVEVLARNAVGDSPRASQVVTVPDATGATVPDAPYIGAARPGRRGGALTAKLSWVASGDGGSELTGFVVLAHKVTSDGFILKTLESEPLGPFAGRAEYRLGRGLWAFQVVAVNALGRSEPSDYSNIVRAR